MIKNVIILVGSSFAFDVLFGMILISKPNLFVEIKKRVPDNNIRHLYKLIFFSIVAVIIIFLQQWFNFNEIIAAIILGFSISLSGIIFSKPKKTNEN